MNVGDTGEATLRVGPGDTARALSISAGDDFPEVLATARMIALMEVAASRVMKSLLAAGQLSVGVGVDVRHLAATPVGVEVRAVATFLGMEGKRYRFHVQAFDAGGVIGEGHHTRAIIAVERLVQGALARNTAR
jgi:fluoroacetyl-CoA thioesterase